MPPRAEAKVADTGPHVSPSSAAMADALARVALGERAAFEELYRLSRAHLFGLILRINPDRAQAEDVLQEVFINVWRARRDFDAARSQPLTWLGSIARHRAIDTLRRRKPEIDTVSTHFDDSDGAADNDRLAAVPSDAAGPLQLLQQAAETRRIEHCLGELTSEQRQCVALAFYEGLSHAEVAQHLAQPLGTVKSWVRRALIALKACLDRIPAAAAGTRRG